MAKTAESVLSGIGNVIQAAFYVEETLPGVDESESENNDASQESESTATATDAPSNSTDGVKSENDEILQEKQRVLVYCNLSGFFRFCNRALISLISTHDILI